MFFICEISSKTTRYSDKYQNLFCSAAFPTKKCWCDSPGRLRACSWERRTRRAAVHIWFGLDPSASATHTANTTEVAVLLKYSSRSWVHIELDPLWVYIKVTTPKSIWLLLFAHALHLMWDSQVPKSPLQRLLITNHYYGTIYLALPIATPCHAFSVTLSLPSVLPSLPSSPRTGTTQHFD